MDAFIASLSSLADIRPLGRIFILGGILVGLWRALQRTTLDRRARTLTWLGVVLPLLAWYFAVWQFARTGGLAQRLAVGGGILTPIPFAVLLPLVVALPLLPPRARVATALRA